MEQDFYSFLKKNQILGTLEIFPPIPEIEEPTTPPPTTTAPPTTTPSPTTTPPENQTTISKPGSQYIISALFGLGATTILQVIVMIRKKSRKNLPKG